MANWNALQDFKESLYKINIAYVFAWYDIKLRYRRTRLGIIWVTLTVFIESLLLSVLFSNLLHEDFRGYFPYFFSGRIIWQLIAGILNDALHTIPNAKNYILNHNLPPPIFILRICMRNFLIFLHNSLLAFILCAMTYEHYYSYLNVLLLPFVASLIMVTLFPFALILSVLGARFRDLTFLLPYCLQIAFYATPIVWKPEALSPKLALIFTFNPLTPMVECLRDVFLNQIPGKETLLFLVGVALLGWLLALYIYNSARDRLCYWML